MFKSKINPETLESSTYRDYFVQLKKEIKKAEKFGQTEVVILSDFKFSCGTISTMMIMGKISGPLAKWYKKIKRERKQEKDFAKGVCLFKQEETGTTLHIALNDGKGKPNKMKKNGKKLFQRLGFTPNIFKGVLAEDGEPILSEIEVQQMDQTADEFNNDKKLAILANQYKQTFKFVANQIIPSIQQKATLTPKHFEVARKAYINAQSFLQRYDEVSEKIQLKFADFKTKVESNIENLKKIVAKVKQLLTTNASISGNVKEVMKQLNEKKIFITNMLQNLSPNIKTLLNRA